MALNGYVIAMGILTLLAIPGTILLFNYNAKLARGLFIATAIALAALNAFYWYTGEIIAL